MDILKKTKKKLVQGMKLCSFRTIVLFELHQLFQTLANISLLTESDDRFTKMYYQDNAGKCQLFGPFVCILKSF